MEKKDMRRNNNMWTGGQVKPEFVSNLCNRSPFMVSASTGRNELGDCVVMVQWPYIVCKVHAYATNIDEKNKGKMYKTSARNSDDNRCAWLNQRRQAWKNGARAMNNGQTVREYVNGAMASLIAEGEYSQGRYDEEFDEPRLVGKVPGLNIYLEVLGSMYGVQLDMSNEHYGAQKDSKVASLFDIRRALQWACSFYRGYINQQRVQFATHADDYQPLEQWHEEFTDADERMFIPREQGIGHSPTLCDPSRRSRFTRHTFSKEEKAEYERLKQENANRQEPLTNAQMAQMAASIVASRHLLDGGGE